MARGAQWGKGWQAQVFERLRDREWHDLGGLFEQIEAQIPLHYAMRAAMLGGATELPTIGEAKWWKFLAVMAKIGIESDGNPKSRKWNDRVRLRYVEGRACEECGGPVIRAGWASRATVSCLRCEAPAIKVVEEILPVPAPEPQPVPALLPALAPPLPPPPPPAPPDQTALRRARREVARWIKQRFFFRLAISINDIERRLLTTTPEELCRQLTNAQARARPPPASRLAA